MIKLHGFAVSNYYNMAKFALLEKGMEFEETSATPSQDATFTAKSPMGKVPFIDTGHGFLSETGAILEYLEAVKPRPAMFPADAYAAAKVREIMKVLELYVELQARRHYGEIFFGGPRNEAAFKEARPVIENGLRALRQLGQFKPYLCGEFSNADIVAAHTFIYAAPVCKTVYDWDIIGAVPGLEAALDATNKRAAGAKVMAAQQSALQAMMAQKSS